MLPSDLRDYLTALPWDTYTPGELNEISAIAMQTAATCRNRRAAIRSAELQAAMSKRPQMTSEQVAANTMREQVYPAGSRIE